MSHVARCSFRENQANRVDRAPAVRIALAVQPQQRKGEAVFHSLRGLSIRNDKDGEIVVFRPQVKERLLRGTAYFPGKSGEGSSAVNSLRQAARRRGPRQRV